MEALILYLVLFFPGVYGASLSGASAAAEVIHFSLLRELGRTLTYSLPALALLWYVILGKTDFSQYFTSLKPKKNDLYSFFIGLPGLIVIGLLISLIILLLFRFSPPRVAGPVSAAGWAVMIVSCLATGYLEETYFRYYLLTKLESRIPEAGLRVAFSSLLFAICHIHQWPWGVLNAALAGVLLSILFLRFRSLHGIAWAHGAYNMFVYTLGTLTQ